MLLNLPSAITDALSILNTIQKQKERKGIPRKTCRYVKHISTSNADALKWNAHLPKKSEGSSMPCTLKVLILIRCLDTPLATTSVDALEKITLKIEMRVAPVLLEVMAGTIIVDHIIVDHDPSYREEDTNGLLE